ncbi:MAG TPA: hypothetical protein VIY96_10450 [Thermoanaerobaculia bacterium]
MPPLPRGPRAVSDLAVEEVSADAVLSFSYPDRLMNGEPLRDVAAIEIYRAADLPPAMTAPRPTPRPGGGGPAPPGDAAPGSSARREAANARLAEEAFFREAKKVDTLAVTAIAERTRGATVVYRDPLYPLLSAANPPKALAYAVVTVRRGGERSPLSNIATLAPDVPSGPPTLVSVTAEEGRICLEWVPPQTDLLGRPAAVGGYRVYRRTLPEEEYGEPLNAEPLTGTVYVDTTAPYGGRHVYTVRATVPGKPKVEGVAAPEVGVDYRDVFVPAAPGRLDALSEGNAVRLVWEPVPAADLAGYVVFRAEGDGAPVRLTEKPVTDPFFTDTSVQPRRRYRYTVIAVDTAGNASPPSPEAVAETL